MRPLAFLVLSFCLAPAALAQPRFVGLGQVAGGIATAGRGISADGRVVVGHSTNPQLGEHRAFRWTEQGGMQELALLPQGTFSGAEATSADGSVVVGLADASGFTKAVRWTLAGGMQNLGTLSGGRSARPATSPPMAPSSRARRPPPAAPSPTAGRPWAAWRT